MKKIILLLLALNIVGAFIAGCGPKADDAATTPGETKDAAAADAEKTE